MSSLTAGPTVPASQTLPLSDGSRRVGDVMASMLHLEQAAGAATAGSSSARAAAADGASSCYSALVNHWWCTAYWRDYRPELTDATKQHIWLTLVSVALGFAIAFPLSLIARRYTRVESLIVGITTVIYTIPSLALFSLLLPWTQLTPKTAIIGLALYSLTILVRNIIAGLRSVPDEVREAALGTGYGPTRLLFTVELPLALPVIIAGLRVAVVSTVALTTVGAIVAYGGLGNLLLEGFRTDFKAQILAASLLCVALAVVCDIVLVVIQWLLTPWSHKRARA
jgi:osmoprotectant transport system permease protein